MSAQPENAAPDRYYAAERLAELRTEIPRLMTTMVIQRAKVEQYKDAYAELTLLRKHLVEDLADARLFLLEAEEYGLAPTAGQLHDGMRGYNLMSGNYKPVYDAVCAFAGKMPMGDTANAQVIGRLMNNVKMGFYPTDPDNIALMLRGIRFPEGVTTNLLDPCCGCGAALKQLAVGNNCYTYGVELDEGRAEEVQKTLHRVGFGSFFYSTVSREAFHRRGV